MHAIGSRSVMCLVVFGVVLLALGSIFVARSQTGKKPVLRQTGAEIANAGEKAVNPGTNTGVTQPVSTADYVLPAIRLTGTELLQQKMTLIVKTKRGPEGSVSVSFRRRPWGSNGKPGRMLDGEVRVTFATERITIEPMSALTSGGNKMKRDYRLTEVACLALSSLPPSDDEDQFELDIFMAAGEYVVMIMPYPARPGSDTTITVTEVDGRLKVTEIRGGI